MSWWCREDQATACCSFPEMDPRAEVPEITESCWDILGKRPDSVMCAGSRMVIRRKGADQAAVVACTLLPYALCPRVRARRHARRGRRAGAPEPPFLAGFRPFRKLCRSVLAAAKAVDAAVPISAHSACRRSGVRYSDPGIMGTVSTRVESSAAPGAATSGRADGGEASSPMPGACRHNDVT